MNYDSALAKLKEIDQAHLLKFWGSLSTSHQLQLLNQITHLDCAVFKAQQNLLHHPSSIDLHQIEPYHDYSHSGNEEDYFSGKKTIYDAKVGCIIVAGGQSTRLRFDGPKGMFPLTRIKHKSLFQVFAEKVKAASKQANYPLPLAIMTSPSNHMHIVNYFKTNRNFGLIPEQLFFFPQGVLPFLDQNANLFLEAPHKISQGPDGNGYALKYFVTSGLWERWKEIGIEYVNFLQIDNPLADPFDARLIGYHDRQDAQVTIKCILRKETQEKAGVIVRRDGKVVVLEYTEIPASERIATTTEGLLKHRLANISLFCFGMDFIKTCSELELPLHTNFKIAKVIDENGVTQKPHEPNAWKFEHYIFDTLPFASKVETLLYPRKECFAPLKNAEGPDSIASVQEAMQESDCQIVSKISGCPLPETPFELSQDFYYPTPYLLTVWKDRPFPNKRYISEGS